MTIYLFKAISLYFLIVGASVLFNKKTYKKLIKELSGEPSLLSFVFGFITLIVGILMVTAHNAWGGFQETLVSLYGWIALAKAIWLLVFPGTYRKLIKKLNNDSYLRFTGVFYILLGVYCCYLAFIA